MKNIKTKQLLYNIAVFTILPFFINIVLESFGNKELLGGIKSLINNPYIFLCNTLIIASTLSLGVVFRRFQNFWIGIVSTCWIALGSINYILLCNRVLPLTAYDLRMIDVIPFIVKKYLSPFSLAVTCLCIVVALVGLFVAFFRALETPRKKTDLKVPVIFLTIMTAITFGNLKYAVSAGILEKRFHELSKSFIKNGFAYSFVTSITDNGVDKVDGYSKELIDSIVGKFVESDSKDVKTPNIIFVQMESFFDLNALNCVKFSTNPVTNFTKLASDNASGLITVPVIGAGTANTEFEVVTGMRIADFGAGEYPYKTVLKDTPCESMARNLKNHGYKSHFIHNYKGGFYGRNNVYSKLGYDYFYSIEYMTGYERNENGWAKDKILLRYIDESLNSTKGADFVTAVSVQGHGEYGGKTHFTRHVTVTQCDDKSMHRAYEYYANQIYEMDQFIGELVDMVSKRDEETILVVYGDHLPSLELKNEDLKNRNIYQTDYFIWNNIGLEYADENLNAYQIGSKILGSLNVTDGVINSCHQNYRNDKQYLYKLQALEYDVLYGEKFAYGGESPYSASKMKVNCRKMKINGMERKKVLRQYML